MKLFLPSFLCLGVALSAAAADPVTHVPMESDGLARVKEKIGNTNLKVYGRHTDENMPGAVGEALRFDGYSTFIEGEIPEYNPSASSSFTLWMAPETYPVVEEDQPNTSKITIAGTIDHDSRKGWAFTLGKTGKYAFECYAGGWLVNVEASDILPCYEWSLLAAVNDTDSGLVTLYRNGQPVAEAKSLGAISNDTRKITIGKTAGASTGNYLVNTFNGLIDELVIYDGVVEKSIINATPENIADLSIPESRFENDKLRPLFHGLPGANWTNETHGLTYSDGKYHLFFQKNANGPYMTRLHWGHLTSENLYDWNEEHIAIAPGEDYDIKGCWSGSVFTDQEITGGLPNAIYTGVDYVKAYIVQAKPKDESLFQWEKKGVIINGVPTGMSDDFRDPYFFRNGDDAYIIVGSAKNGVGATTLHKYNKVMESWSNDGKIFFAGTSAAEHGTFWEMPNITPLGNDKWLFTVTPQNTSNGVHTLYWIGEINTDGSFKPDSERAQDIELINGQGYGLLSPTIYSKDGKTLMLGIVPDKLSTQDNCQSGWAHLYSFPREISLGENGMLIQKPYAGLADLRSSEAFELKDLSLDGTQILSGVDGRQVEVKGVFTVGSVPFGFNLFKGTKGEASVTYNPADNRLEVNLTKLNRKDNDRNSFNGRYVAALPVAPQPGSDLILDVWVDGSIMDIFVNDTYATSVRVFPTDNDANGVEAFATGGTVNVKSLQGWKLSSKASSDTPGNNPDAGIEDIIQDLPEYVNVYSINGTVVKRNVQASEALTGLTKGIYLIGPHKVLVK